MRNLIILGQCLELFLWVLFSVRVELLLLPTLSRVRIIFRGSDRWITTSVFVSLEILFRICLVHDTCIIKLQGMSPLEELLHIVTAMRYFDLVSVQPSLTQLSIYLQIFEKCRMISEQGSQIIRADVSW